MYTAYEEKIDSDLRAAVDGRVAIIPLLKKGDFLIWDANLLHGSPMCLDNSRTRLSQVTHYHFSDVELFYNPAFSRAREGKYVRRQVQFIPAKIENEK